MVFKDPHSAWGQASPTGEATFFKIFSDYYWETSTDALGILHNEKL